MHSKRIIAFVVIFVICAIAVYVCPYGFNTYCTSRVKITWNKSGYPGIVEGRVIDIHGKPVMKKKITIGDSSGDYDTFTGKDGEFQVKIVSSEVFEVRIDNIKVADWEYWCGISTTEGLNFLIVDKSYRIY